MKQVRNMRRIIFLIATLLSGYLALAQQEVNGRVVDTHGKGIEYVNVVALQLPDSSFIAGRVTDANGQYQFDQLPSKCLLIFSSIGYHKQSLMATTAMKVVLQEATTELSEVFVRASRIIERPGGYSINLQSDPALKGRQVLQALEWFPNISVDNGKVSLLNRPLMAIYIDGLKVTDESELSTIPLDQIQSIEVDYSSMVREGAGSRGGVLRIKLKKQRVGGWDASLKANTSYMPHYGSRGGGLSSFFMARWEKITLRNSTSLSSTLYLNDEQSELFNKQTKEKQQSSDTYRNWAHLLTNRFSVSMDITPSQFLATSLYYQYLLQNPKHDTKNILNSSDKYQLQRNPLHLLQWLINYKWDINKATSLGFSSDFLNRDYTQETKEQKPLFYNAMVKQNTRMIRVRPDLNHSFKHGEALSIGGDLQWIDQKEITSEILPTTMQSFTPAFFSSLSGALGKVQYEIAARLQYNKMDIKRGEDTYRYRYFGVFPTLSMMYLFNPEQQHLVTLQVERSMDNIPYSAISGYKEYAGSNSYTVGNPNLDTPISTQAFALLSLWGKLNLGLIWVHYQSPIYFERRIDKEDAQLSYTIPMNGKYQSVQALTVEWRQNITKWWDTKTSAMMRIHSGNAGVVFRNEVSGTFTHNSTFLFSPDFRGGLRLYYEPTSRYLDKKMISVWSVSGNLYKSFLDDKLGLDLEFDFYRKQRNLITDNQFLTLHYYNLTHSPHVTLTISYRFGGGKKVKALSNTKALQQYQETKDVVE